MKIFVINDLYCFNISVIWVYYVFVIPEKPLWKYRYIDINYREKQNILRLLY